MRLRILGSAGAELPDFRPPAFLIDDHLLLDAGTIGSVLTEEEQLKLRNIFITHSHLDHIRSIPVLADNIVIGNPGRAVNIFSIPAVISALHDHLFNNIIWPDFTRIPTPDNPVLTFTTIVPGRGYEVAGYSITALEVHHTVPAVGYIVTKDGATLAYTGDTGPTDLFWHHVSGADALIVEVSFPDSMEKLALLTQHLTCSLLRTELKKIGKLPRRILITHPKPQYYDTIRREIESMGMPEVELLHDGSVFDL